MGNWRTHRSYSGRGRNFSARRSGRNRNAGHSKNMQITGVNLSVIVAIIGLAVLFGFLTTKFVIYPLLLGEEASFDTDFASIITGRGAGDTEGSNSDESSGSDEGTGETGSSSDSGDNAGTMGSTPVTNPGGQGSDASQNASGYCIQYGSFSTQGAADELVAELKASGLTAQIVNVDGTYKVVGQLFATKDEATAAKESVLQYASPEYADVFVTNI